MDFLKTKLALMCVAALAATGCSTSRITMYTEPPGAQVYAKPLGQSELKPLGVTPLSVDSKEIEQRFNGSGPVFLEFRKNGYVSSVAVVTELSAVDLNLSIEMTPENGFENLDHLNNLVDTMFECQRLARVKRYDVALEKLKQLEKITPQVAAIYELEGGIYYLQGKYQDALDAYRRSSQYNPKSVETARMKNLLEQRFGVERVPSSLNLLTPEQINKEKK